MNTVDQVGKIFDAMNEFLGSVGLVTLGLGAIGIINIMLVAVADRTQEIGLRKALGATNASIMFQFFVEGAFLTLLSGITGIAAAAGVMALLSGVSLGEGFDPPKLVARTAALAVTALALAGVAAGLYPARRAALLQPVEALRKEWSRVPSAGYLSSKYRDKASPGPAERNPKHRGHGGTQSKERTMHRDLLAQAFAAMRHDLRKTTLTMAGMAWGIATVVLLLAYGNGFGRAIENIFQSFGATAVGIFPGRTSQQAGGNKAGRQVRFTNDDIELLTE